MKTESLAIPRRKPLLAHILEREEGLEPAKLERALQAWHQHREAGRSRAFGQVLLDLRLIHPITLRRFVELQRRLAAAPGDRKPLGVIAVEMGAVRPSMVAETLAEAGRTGARLGEVLVARGVLRRPQVDVLLNLQKQGRLAA